MLELLDIILDKNNRDPIVMMDEKEREITFEQVAVIPYQKNNEKVLYVILKPIDKFDGVKDDEALVFLVDQDRDGNTILCVEDDELVAIDVFDKYYDLLEKARKNK